MIRKAVLAAILGSTFAAEVRANDWEKFFVPSPVAPQAIDSSVAPEVMPITGDEVQLVASMFQRGFALIGYSSFNTDNDNTKDAKKLGQKLKARFIAIRTHLASTSTTSIPITTPSVSTTVSSGTATAYGTRGSATGTYSGNSTTYGTQTNYIPLTLERFDKAALYFKEMPKKGAGFQGRAPTDEEAASLDTRRAIVIQFVRDGSPAYNADLLPGDAIYRVNGDPFDASKWGEAMRGAQPVKLTVARDARRMEVSMTVPDDWKP